MPKYRVLALARPLWPGSPKEIHVRLTLEHNAGRRPGGTGMEERV
jgi:hypothetical protein